MHNPFNGFTDRQIGEISTVIGVAALVLFVVTQLGGWSSRLLTVVRNSIGMMNKYTAKRRLRQLREELTTLGAIHSQPHLEVLYVLVTYLTAVFIGLFAIILLESSTLDHVVLPWLQSNVFRSFGIIFELYSLSLMSRSLSRYRNVLDYGRFVSESEKAISQLEKRLGEISD